MLNPILSQTFSTNFFYNLILEQYMQAFQCACVIFITAVQLQAISQIGFSQQIPS